ncbi:glycosyltransferase [Saccharospirillum salsuginis]|uniref:1,2-diacylglycerol 3-glucosyltransferase n=1 Tax=Saccharospirillum salsuginis TaxID=418750 RepID=A0A918KGV0_9GAMM|nr:glycosyltransferase [Saccharospirillum salsuginis]GGX63227.1 1,2-diacylglycerol 3-glucosyltransferase [Saccharospirillum salsuginis]
MNLLIVTNTFTPHIGGVARSVTAFTEEYRRRGHKVMVIAPEFEGQPDHEEGVYRVHALRRFNASDFSVALPIHPNLSKEVNAFQPDLVHSQHPFLLGLTAVRLARHRDLPLVFTHHTLYEQYTHYVPGDSPAMKRYVIELCTRYANLADQVFAPSESLRRIIQDRGVETPVQVVPTGVTPGAFDHGDGDVCRRSLGIPEEAFVVGHLGRLAPEKNLEFLTQSLVAFVQRNDRARVLIVGVGPGETGIRQAFEQAGLSDRLFMLGVLPQDELSNALHAMDVFAFASTSETQGMVVTEAMAAGLPVVALDASGVREVVVDRHNGRLLPEADVSAFGDALAWVDELDEPALERLRTAVRETAEAFSMQRSADKALRCFLEVKPKSAAQSSVHESRWEEITRAIRTEWDILKSVAGAGEALVRRSGNPKPTKDDA